MSENTSVFEFNQQFDLTASDTIPDTLVLQIIEHDIDTCKRDTILYLIYDNKNQHYIIRGLRTPTSSVREPLEYSFQCNDEGDLADFIQFVIDPENKVSYILYNYNNLPDKSNDISYYFLEENRHICYEIAGYDNCKLKRAELVRNLQMLKNVYNYY
jgi:hypothetical protein